MAPSAKVSIRKCFAGLRDPRREHTRRQNLWDIIALTICAVGAGADRWVEVAAYGVRKEAWLRTFLELPNGIPSHDTFGRVFALLDPTAFREGFLAWVGALVEATAGRLIEPVKIAARHPRLLRAIGTMDGGVEAARSVPVPLRRLASLQTAMLIGRPF